MPAFSTRKEAQEVADVIDSIIKAEIDDFTNPPQAIDGTYAGVLEVNPGYWP